MSKEDKTMLIIKNNFEECLEMALPELSNFFSVYSLVERYEVKYERMNNDSSYKLSRQALRDLENGVTPEKVKEKEEQALTNLFFRLVDLNRAYKEKTSKYILRSVEKNISTYRQIYEELTILLCA